MHLGFTVQAADISIHALREEGDLGSGAMRGGIRLISIHALREEGDAQRSTWPRPQWAISIHALREEGDLRQAFQVQKYYEISIHALREEGDLHLDVIRKSFFAFLSTPSARRATAWPTEAGESVRNFYPRPPRGGRLHLDVIRKSFFAFLSTPSARRATAKTETKSLFSNKLYNILHEFRRALIYNGSKSYPNHAK